MASIDLLLVANPVEGKVPVNLLSKEIFKSIKIENFERDQLICTRTIHVHHDGSRSQGSSAFTIYDQDKFISLLIQHEAKHSRIVMVNGLPFIGTYEDAMCAVVDKVDAERDDFFRALNLKKKIAIQAFSSERAVSSV